MIKLTLKGRMGNQMFQFAYAYILAKKNKSAILLKPISHFGYCLDFFSLPVFGSFLPKRYFVKFQKLIWELFPAKQQISENSCFYTYHEPSINQITEIEGFFQDGIAYVKHKNELKSLFKIKNSIEKRFQKKYQHLMTKKNVVLNVRLAKDYQTAYFEEIKSNGLLPIEWYVNALEKIDFSEYDHLIVIADDITLAKESFNINHFNPIYIDDEISTDYLFLLHSDCLIIPNSSFSWWPAFLNNNPNKKVYAPKNWVGCHVGIEYPKGIMINDFEWI